jgi:hypothetical protein
MTARSCSRPTPAISAECRARHQRDDDTQIARYDQAAATVARRRMLKFLNENLF